MLEAGSALPHRRRHLRPLPVVLHASDKGIKREPHGLSGPPNLSETDSEPLEHAAAVAGAGVHLKFQGSGVMGFLLPPTALALRPARTHPDQRPDGPPAG